MAEDVSDLVKERIKKLEFWRERKVEPYGQRFLPKDPVGELIRNFQDGTKVRVAGRLVAIRVHGKSGFLDLRDETGKIQLYASVNDLGENGFHDFLSLDVGDIVGVEGALFKSKTGEITVKMERFQLLSKILQSLPEKWHGLRDVEIRYRRRYLDLIANEEVREIFKKRSLILRGIRRLLDGKGFMEVETPMMQPLAGGARAEPFKTHHRVLHRDFYLRVAPELYLKRLLVGGFERVYELGRNFRNEGISVRHNPEFSMLELYQSYADLTDMMELTEELVVTLVKELHAGEELNYGTDKVCFKRPWKRMSFYEALQAKTGVDWREADIRKEAARREIAMEPHFEEVDILNELFDRFVQPGLVDPTFVVDYPLCMSPLAKKKTENTADRFELFVARLELANAFSELNDPLDQRKRFETVAATARGNKEIDEDFLLALEYGLPPAGGLGIGVDRLVMLLTNQASIREVILFPQLRPEGP